MRNLAILTFVSLDGIMQGVRSSDEDTSGGFRQGGWAAPYWDDVMAQVRQEAMAEPYDMLLGRKTYELFAPNWTTSPNRGLVYVASSHLADPEWENVRIMSGDIITQITQMKNGDGPLLQIHGSWELIQSLLVARLIDEFRLWVFPVVVGAGKRLFDADYGLNDLSLVKTAPTGNGVVMNIYRR